MDWATMVLYSNGLFLLKLHPSSETAGAYLDDICRVHEQADEVFVRIISGGWGRTEEVLSPYLAGVLEGAMERGEIEEA